jgi:hypothetical protein
MKRFRPTVFAMILTIGASSSAFAGHIAGGRTAGNIPGGRTAGNIAGGRTSGNIAGGRATMVGSSSLNSQFTGTTRLELESAISGTFASLIRMLLESGALF